MSAPIVTFQWKDYTVTVFSIDDADGFVFSAIDYCGEQWNNLMGSKEETELYNFTIEKIEERDAP